MAHWYSIRLEISSEALCCVLEQDTQEERKNSRYDRTFFDSDIKHQTVFSVLSKTCILICLSIFYIIFVKPTSVGQSL